jgi:hypothetical protein
MRSSSIRKLGIKAPGMVKESRRGETRRKGVENKILRRKRTGRGK